MVNTLCADSINTITTPFDTSTYRETTPFIAEADLVDKFESATKPFIFDRTGFLAELDAGNGIADIAIYKQRKDWTNYSDLTHLKPQWVYPMVALPYRKLFSTSQFSKLACISEKTASKILNMFCDIGFCTKSVNGWIKIKQPRAPIKQIFSIEAKLRDWKRALYQATRYLEFSHQSWVLLDSHYSKPAIKNLQEFQIRNIGLLTMNSSGEINIINNSISSPPKSLYRYWFANTVILNQDLKKDTL